MVDVIGDRRMRRTIGEGEEKFQNALAMAGDSFRNSLDSSPMGIRIVTAEGELLYANRAILDMWGFDSFEDMRSAPAICRYTPQSYAEHQQRAAGRRRGDPVPSHYEISVVRKDGGIRHLVVFRKEVVWGGGNHFQVLYQDITELKLAAEALRRSEVKYRTLVANLREGIYQADCRGIFVTLNEAGARILGFDSPEQALGRRSTIEFCSDLKTRANIRRQMGRTGSFAGEIQVVKLDGTPVWLRVNSDIVLDNSGKPDGYEGTFSDITRRRQAEETLRRTNQVLTTLVKCSKVLANATHEQALLDSMLHLIVQTPGYRMAWVGYSEPGKTRAVRPVSHAGFENGYLCAASFSWADNELGRGAVGKAIRTGQMCTVPDTSTDPDFQPWRCHAMERGYASSLALPLTHRHTFGVLEIYGAEPATFCPVEIELLSQLTHDLAYSIAAIRTRAAYRRMRMKISEYRELNNAKSALFSTVSHELRTPLATIKGFCTFLLEYDRKIKNADKRHYLQSMDRATDRLTDLVDHMLDISRLDAGLLKLHKVPTSIAELVRDVVNEARVRDPKHRIVDAVEKALPKIMGDPKRLRQVLDNLINNSAKFSEEGTTIVIGARRNERELLVSVADEGVGIPQAEREKVFTRMYRVEQRLGQARGGLGLGLSLCKGLIETSGGRIWMESNHGKGNTCIFTLPI